MGVALQHADFVVRNPIYETLIRCDWPLAEADGRHFIYYLAFWLPPALICKCFSWSDVFIANYVLTAWIELGLALALTVLWGKFRMATLLFLVLLIFQGPLDGVVRWSVHLFNPQGQTAHELYLTVLAFFGGVAPTMQLHYTFHHTTLLWLFLAMAVAWDIPPRHQLFLASLCLLASPIGSLGLLVFIAVRALVRRIFTESARLANMQHLWEGHLHHPEHPWNAPLWGSGEGAAFRAAYFQKAGESADGPLRPFSTGMRTDAEPSAAPASRP